MKSVLHFLGTRQQLSDNCQIIAEKVKLKTKYPLTLSSNISISVDEWSDCNMRRYLGLTARCISNGKVASYLLALKKITSIHTDTIELNKLMNDILEDYDIKDRIVKAVSDNCNLMTCSFKFSSILRLPCACHILNLLLKAFIQPSEDIIQEITTATRSLKTSSCYTALKDDFNEPKLKSYTEICWISLFESFKALQKSRESIETFYLIESSQMREVKNKL